MINTLAVNCGQFSIRGWVYETINSELYVTLLLTTCVDIAVGFGLDNAMGEK